MHVNVLPPCMELWTVTCCWHAAPHEPERLRPLCCTCEWRDGNFHDVYDTLNLLSRCSHVCVRSASCTVQRWDSRVLSGLWRILHTAISLHPIHFPVHLRAMLQLEFRATGVAGPFGHAKGAHGPSAVSHFKHSLFEELARGSWYFTQYGHCIVILWARTVAAVLSCTWSASSTCACVPWRPRQHISRLSSRQNIHILHLR